MRMPILFSLFLAALCVQASELYEAIVNDQVAEVRAYLTAGGDPNALLEIVVAPDPPRTADERTLHVMPLDLALFVGRAGNRPASDAIAVLLLEAGADPDLAEEHSPISASLLGRAAAGGMRETVNHLLQRDAAALLPAEGPSPLITASSRGYTDVVLAMLEAARVHGIAWGRTLDRAFVASAQGEHDDVASVLLDAGVDPRNEAVFSLAVHYLGIDLVRSLLSRGADAAQRWGPSRPLDHAVHRLHRRPGAESEQVLLEVAGATPDLCQPLPDSGLTEEISEATLQRLGELIPQCDWHALMP